MFFSNETQFRQVLAEAQREGVRLTPAAQDAIYLVVDSITRDPHRTWQFQQDVGRLFEAQTQAIAQIVPHLRVLARAGAGEVSAFDVFHSMSRIVDSFCPFEKA